MNSADYKYPITQCDVPPGRRPKLESYRAKRGQWLTWLDADEHHAIWTNLSAMAWTDVSFGIFRELAEGHEKAGEKTCLHNPLTMRFDGDVLDWFKAQGPRYQTRMNAVLRRFMEAHRNPQR